MKIGILGIGGVGGYFGGLLAEHYHKSEETRIVFLARDETIRVISDNGLMVSTPERTFFAHPETVTGNPKQAGILDLLICCTKTYDLEKSLDEYRSVVGPGTFILPLLNGVDAVDLIRKKFPEHNILEGCVYIVAKKTGPGIIEKTGKIESLYFGSSSVSKTDLDSILKIFTSAGIDAYCPDDIKQTVWEKFVFISPLATLTSFLDMNIGSIREDEDYFDMLRKLIAEVISVAKAMEINLPDDIHERTLEKIIRLNFEATSSMHRDFQKGGKTEYLSLTKYIIDKGSSFGLALPVYNMMLEKFE
jgi:2-dehydropantoate 2-reductase